MHAFVFEPTSLWTAELERAFSGQNLITFRWHPHRTDLLANAALPQLAILVLATDDDGIDLICRFRMANPTAVILCLPDGEDDHWESLARECGATAVLPDTTSKAEVVQLVRQIAVRESNQASAPAN